MERLQQIDIETETVYAGAGVLLPHLIKAAKEESLGGWNFSGAFRERWAGYKNERRRLWSGSGQFAAGTENYGF